MITGECPYTPSPGGEGKLDGANVFAVWVEEHLSTWGQAAQSLIPWPETAGEKEIVLEKITFIHRRRAQLEAELAQRRPARGGTHG